MGEIIYKIVAVGKRGQVVIPADVRRKCCVGPGDKILVFGQAVSKCIWLVKFRDLVGLSSVYFGSDLERRDDLAAGLQRKER